jgi:hypothetical protein
MFLLLFLFSFLAFLVIVPKVLRGLDIVLLTFLFATAKQDHEGLVILSQVDPISWPEINLALTNAAAKSLNIR